MPSGPTGYTGIKDQAGNYVLGMVEDAPEPNTMLGRD